MTFNTSPMSVADAMQDQRTPTVSATDRHGDGEAIDIALYRYGAAHGGTDCVATLDRATATALRDKLTAILAR